MLVISPDLAIADEDIEERFVRASGPGGQHVNKTSTAVQLRFDVHACAALPADVRKRLIALAGSRVSDAGVLILTAQRFRSREQNRADARERLVRLIRRACTAPRPRRPTRVPASARRRRLDDKRQRGRTKRMRRSPPPDD